LKGALLLLGSRQSVALQKGKLMVKQSEGAVQEKPASLPAKTDTAMFAEYAGMGMETVGAQDIAIPRFKILQDLSPEVNKRKDKYVEGAVPGQIFNTAFKQASDSINVLPCIYRRHHIEWLPERGGYVQDHGEDASLLRQARPDEKRNMILPNGNIIVETATWYVIDLDTGSQAIIPMSRTQLGPSRDWMTLATAEKLDRPDGQGKYTPPLFFRGYTLTTALREKGENSWFIWQPKKGATVTELAEQLNQPELLEEAIKFAKLVRAGEIKVDASAFEEDEGRGSRQEDDNDTI
jgi:hypothetical protein